jgi:hypothetical protein
MQPIPVGPALVEVLTLAYRANLPVLLHGRHGVGKSTVLGETAARLGIGLIVRDLSLMEPPDLIGIPHVGEDGRTHYAMPAFLPQTGRGLLVFEELNRCPRYMATPCLQLLTARQLNDYDLPPGWLPCAAINDAEEGYWVEDLDAALLSRFVQVKVVPEVRAWAQWARASRQVHEHIVAFVEQSPGIFRDPVANPRAWVMASHLLTAWEADPCADDLLVAALAGVVGEKWALAFMQVYHGAQHPLAPTDIIEAYPQHRAVVLGWMRQGALDVVAASVERLKRHLQPQPMYEALLDDAQHKAHVELFFSDLPADLQQQLHLWLAERGFTGLRAVGSTPRRQRKKRS